jgi:c(7)-type cytochrome triheme protein
MKKWYPVALCAVILLSPFDTSAKRIADEVLIPVAETGSVRFSHYRHIEALGNNCVICHNDIFHIQPEKNPTFTMADMAEGKSCGACHNGREAFGVSGNCSPCHPTRDVSFEIPDFEDVTFSHDEHTFLYGCVECHPDLFLPQPDNPAVSMESMKKGESCGACHDDSTAFSVAGNCEQCHHQ